MQVSVIIPVYNAEDYLITAVDSALSQPEVGEVILVEDKSPDNSLSICWNLQNTYKNVRLLQHTDGKNHGAAVSRNLGIQNSQFDFIAFLDADDYYLPNRFKIANELFISDKHIDGVYEAIGMHFYHDQARIKWFESGENELTTITEIIDPSNLFETLINGNKGYLHLDGLVVKKSLFENSGLFIDNLRLHQDTALFIQMSLVGNLVPGSLNTPVAMRGVHNDNRILSNYHRPQTLFLLWKALFHWAYKKRISKNRLSVLFHNYLYSALKLAQENSSLSMKSFDLIKEFILESLNHPYLFSRSVLHYISDKKNN